jgi:hypothetical protein
MVQLRFLGVRNLFGVIAGFEWFVCFQQDSHLGRENREFGLKFGEAERGWRMFIG